MSIVWIPMLPADSEQAASEAAGMIDDPRVRHFYDAQHHAGKAIADHLGGPGEIAWDIYLFYGPGVRWEHEPPEPLEWWHQLRTSWPDPAHHRRGEPLVDQLGETMNRLMGEGARG